ncbi:MAG TPA: hypothetical protein VF756_00245 [Thermoanaerobaculia bacterium]
MSAQTGEVLMRFCSDQARELLSRVDPGRVHVILDRYRREIRQTS